MENYGMFLVVEKRVEVWEMGFIIGFFMGAFLVGTIVAGITTERVEDKMLATCPNQAQIQAQRKTACKPDIVLQIKDGWVKDLKYNFHKK